MTAAADEPVQGTATSVEAGPLADVIVVEVGDEWTSYAGRLLAEAGAYVVKVEPPEGAPSRRYYPSADGGTESLHWAALNAGKHSVVLELSDPDGARALADMLARADVVLDGAGVGALAGMGLDVDTLRSANPGLVYARITPFGTEGPWAAHRSTDLTSLAMSGMLSDCGYDDHDLPPVRPGGGQAYNTAGVQAVLGILVALLWRRTSGLGQLVDVTAHEAGATCIEFADLYWWYWQELTHRQTARHAFPTVSAPNHYETADGRFIVGVLILHHDHVWRDIKAWLAENGLLLDLADPSFDDPVHRRKHQHLIHDRIAVLAAMMSAEDFYRRGQQSGWVVGTVRHPADLLDDAQLAARDFWHTQSIDGHEVQFPKSAVRVHGAVAPIGRPPALDADVHDVARRLGLTEGGTGGRP